MCNKCFRKLKLWIRYLDDTFTIQSSGEADKLLEHLNKQHKNKVYHQNGIDCRIRMWYSYFDQRNKATGVRKAKHGNAVEKKEPQHPCKTLSRNWTQNENVYVYMYMMIVGHCLTVSVFLSQHSVYRCAWRATRTTDSVNEWPEWNVFLISLVSVLLSLCLLKGTCEPPGIRPSWSYHGTRNFCFCHIFAYMFVLCEGDSQGFLFVVFIFRTLITYY